MDSLTPIAPLGGLEPRVDEVGDLRIAEVVGISAVSLMGPSAGLQSLVLEGLGLELPGVERSSEAGDWAALWMAREQWILIAPAAGHPDPAPMIESMVGARGAVVEQSDGWCCFDIAGSSLSDLFERLCSVPVRSMEAGRVVRTSIHHVPATLWRRDDHRMTVMAPRSMAAFLHESILVTARSIA